MKHFGQILGAGMNLITPWFEAIYNSPAQQVKRLKKAGFSKNMLTKLPNVGNVGRTSAIDFSADFGQSEVEQNKSQARLDNANAFDAENEGQERWKDRFQKYSIYDQGGIVEQGQRKLPSLGEAQMKEEYRNLRADTDNTMEGTQNLIKQREEIDMKMRKMLTDINYTSTLAEKTGWDINRLEKYSDQWEDMSKAEKLKIQREAGILKNELDWDNQSKAKRTEFIDSLDANQQGQGLIFLILYLLGK